MGKEEGDEGGAEKAGESARRATQSIGKANGLRARTFARKEGASNLNAAARLTSIGYLFGRNKTTTIMEACKLASKSSVARRPALRASALRKGACPRARVAPNRLVRCDGFIGSPENVAICTGTTLMLVAMRFGYAPSSSKIASLDDGLDLKESGSDMITGDPAGMTLADVFAGGAMGHMIAIGMILGFKGIGAWPFV